MTRKGDWMTTFTGKQFWPLDPRPEEVDIEDIAHALSMMCRFGGHCREFYSVAEHSVRCWEVHQTLACLLHDAAEAYVADVIRPVKQFIDGYRAIESGVAGTIELHFGLPFGATEGDEIKAVDRLLLSTEHRDLLPDGHTWSVDSVTPLKWKIVPWTPMDAKSRFLRAFHQCRA